ncbi:MAG TPA: ATP-binding protein [Thermomicrobiales bacterium]|nr:ATP-binding protein [Thermomicrobiales bacterium]
MPIRLRITLATTFLMAIALAALGTGMYITTSSSLHNDMDNRLRRVYEGFQENPGFWRTENGEIRELIINPEPFASGGTFLQIRNATGSQVVLSENLNDKFIPVSQDVLQRNEGFDTVYYDTVIDGAYLRVYSGRLNDPRGNLAAYVQVAEPLQPVNATLSTLKRNIIWGSVFSTLMLACGAWLVGDAAMRPLAKMSNTARSIGRTGDLSTRLHPPKTRDEAQHLGETFNEMLSRLEETFNAQRRFVADASHELRTPLTALRANADIMLRQIEGGIYDREDLAEGLSDIRDEVDRMTRLVQHLLTLARADVGWRPELEVIDLVDIARDAARVASPLVRGQQFALDMPPPDRDGSSPEVDVRGNADQLRQLILILLDNAFTYAPADSDVRLAVRQDDDVAVLSVHDSGPGIAPDHLRRIFERFFRTDDARARSSGGTGLGLAIARWIVTVHDGEITATSGSETGTTFEVRLPRAREDAKASRTSSEVSRVAPAG